MSERLFEIARVEPGRKVRLVVTEEDARRITDEWGGGRAYSTTGSAVDHWLSWAEVGDETGIAWGDGDAICHLDLSRDGTLYLGRHR